MDTDAAVRVALDTLADEEHARARAFEADCWARTRFLTCQIVIHFLK